MKVFGLILLGLSLISVTVAYPQQRYDPRMDLSRVINFAPNLGTAVDNANAQGKPIMLIVHRSSCPACKKLIPQLTSNSELQSISRNFVVVQSVDNSDPECEKLGPKYYPRIMFYDSNGNDLQITNPYNRNYPLYYERSADVITAMKMHINAPDTNRELGIITE